MAWEIAVIKGLAPAYIPGFACLALAGYWFACIHLWYPGCREAAVSNIRYDAGYAILLHGLNCSVALVRRELCRIGGTVEIPLLAYRCVDDETKTRWKHYKFGETAG